MPKTRTPLHDFPRSVSATSLSTFKACARKSEYYTFMRWVPKEKSIHLHAGGAFASAIESARLSFYVAGTDAERAIGEGLKTLWREWGDFETPDKAVKTWMNCSHAYIGYFDTWPLGKDPITPLVLASGTAIEFDFTADLGIKHPSTGDPILYTGRADMLGQFQSSLWNVDEKTTSGIGPAWARKWSMRSQFLGTIWAAAQYGHKLRGTIIRGIAILKNENKTAEHLAPANPHLVERWHESTLATVKQMIQIWKSGQFPYNFDDSCIAYNSTCEYMPLCQAQDYKKWLMYFAQRTR